jgi:hypothetical protein
MKTTSEIVAAIQAQRNLCKEKDLPHFAPSDGLCYDCRKSIYQDYNRPGWDGLTHVTGCPHCNYSYCE